MDDPQISNETKKDPHVPTPLFLLGSRAALDRRRQMLHPAPAPSVQCARRRAIQPSSKWGPETLRVPKTLWGMDEA